MIEGISYSIVIAAFVDTFVLSGYFTYGAAIVAAATLAFTNGMTEQQVFVLASLGVFLAEVFNFISSKLVKTDKWLAPRLSSVKSKPSRFYRLVSIGLHQLDDSFLQSLLKHVLLRFVPITRPINSVLFGSLSSFSLRPFLVILVSSVIWVAFWVLIFGNLLLLIEENLGTLS
jgi:membrane protein DedA with SNARE-associated domain